MPYSKAKANSGTRGGVASVWRRRTEEQHGINSEGDLDTAGVRLEAILETCRKNDGGAAMVGCCETDEARWAG